VVLELLGRVMLVEMVLQLAVLVVLPLVVAVALVQ
jgi:hypothetical protein